MSIRVATADSFPYACIEYVCSCGATAHAHGTAAGSLPPGWLRTDAPGDSDGPEHRCPRCAATTGHPAVTRRR